ncbi:hypothetical protein M011DRAFT_529146 [Sporormia fimetaria CBS 119925]|uniref:F-box domain-containing protein n=1 Tax=Sporormia fimetaria CBS 119925 TaxID=1340428 RepID=A0A6A6V0B7_9PLEO|nr:hypothetical protein M011DRAFT_529146 [Sporormia fimetaria CBS 119925]
MDPGVREKFVEVKEAVEVTFHRVAEPAHGFPFTGMRAERQNPSSDLKGRTRSETITENRSGLPPDRTLTHSSPDARIGRRWRQRLREVTGQAFRRSKLIRISVAVAPRKSSSSAAAWPARRRASKSRTRILRRMETGTDKSGRILTEEVNPRTSKRAHGIMIGEDETFKVSQAKQKGKDDDTPRITPLPRKPVTGKTARSSNADNCNTPSRVAVSRGSSSRFLTIDREIRERILTDVLEDCMHASVLCLRDLGRLPAVFHTCKQLRMEAKSIWAQKPLRIVRPLLRDTDELIEAQRAGLQAVFGDVIPHLILSAWVIQPVKADTWENFVTRFASAPGIELGSRLLLLEYDDNPRDPFLNIYTAELLGHRINRLNDFEVAFAPCNHSSMFGWPRFAAVRITHLTVQVRGAELWDTRLFGSLSQYRRLPLIALIASIIASKPRGLKLITLTGLERYRNFVERLWQAIPDTTPLTGLHAPLDQLVMYPFADCMPEIGEVYLNRRGHWRKHAKVGNLFGLRSEMQWQTQIMNARHNTHRPEWEFLD